MKHMLFEEKPLRVGDRVVHSKGDVFTITELLLEPSVVLPDGEVAVAKMSWLENERVVRFTSLKSLRLHYRRTGVRV